MPCIRSGRRWFVTCAGLFPVVLFICLLTASN
nr:MAG TPA: Putative holin [Caudoviricetes sp.]DAP83557.1 MAG TPA: Putative holin [Caudoviricetes sp.]